jgi:hypothetical protein
MFMDCLEAILDDKKLRALYGKRLKLSNGLVRLESEPDLQLTDGQTIKAC